MPPLACQALSSRHCPNSGKQLSSQWLFLPTRPPPARAAPGRVGAGWGQEGPPTLLSKMSTSPFLWGPGRPQLSATGRRLAGEVGRTTTRRFSRVEQGSPPVGRPYRCPADRSPGVWWLVGGALSSLSLRSSIYLPLVPRAFCHPRSPAFKPHSQDHLLPKDACVMKSQAAPGSHGGLDPAAGWLQVKLPSSARCPATCSSLSSPRLDPGSLPQTCHVTAGEPPALSEPGFSHLCSGSRSEP